MELFFILKLFNKFLINFIIYSIINFKASKLIMNTEGISPNSLDEMVDDDGEHDELIEPRFRYKRILGDLITVYF